MAPGATQRNPTQPNQRCRRTFATPTPMPMSMQRGQRISHCIYITRGRFPLPPWTQGPLAVGVAAAFRGDPAPRTEPPHFSSAGDDVGFALANQTEIARGAETAVASEVALAEKPGLARNPTVLFRLFGDRTFALSGRAHRAVCPV